MKMLTHDMQLETRVRHTVRTSERYPFLGSALFVGPLDDMARTEGVRPFGMFIPACADSAFPGVSCGDVLRTDFWRRVEEYEAPDIWFEPADGICTAAALQQRLVRDKGQDHLLGGMANYVIQELKAVAGLLAALEESGGMFRVTLLENETPPRELAALLDRIYGEIRESLIKVLQRLGRDDLIAENTKK